MCRCLASKETDAASVPFVIVLVVGHVPGMSYHFRPGEAEPTLVNFSFKQSLTSTDFLIKSVNSDKVRTIRSRT